MAEPLDPSWIGTAIGVVGLFGSALAYVIAKTFSASNRFTTVEKTTEAHAESIAKLDAQVTVATHDRNNIRLAMSALAPRSEVTNQIDALHNRVEARFDKVETKMERGFEKVTDTIISKLRSPHAEENR